MVNLIESFMGQTQRTQSMLVDMERGFPIEGGLSLDDNVGVFYGGVDPSATFVGGIIAAPVGSLYISKVGAVSNIYQRWGTGDLEWRRVFFGDTPLWGGKLVPMFWAEPVVNKRDWFRVGAATGSNAAYVFPFDLIIREIIIITQKVSTSDQDILLKVTDSPDRVLRSYVTTAQEVIHIVVDLDWIVPATKKIRLRAGEGTGSIKDVIVNILGERQT